MATPSVHSRPGWYRVVAFAFLLWNLFGLWSLYAQASMTAAQLAALPAAQQTLYRAMPAWLWGVYGVAVVAGTLGALLWVVGRRGALPLFWISLLAIVVQFGYSLFPGGAIELLGPAQALPLPIIIVVAALLQLWFARWGIRRGWLV